MPGGAGWDSYGWGWRGVQCDAAGGSVERMCAPQPFLELRAASCLCSHKLAMGCRSMHTYFGIPSSLTADIGALAGLSLTWLCAPIPQLGAPRHLLHRLALSPLLSSAPFA